jgi:hypothetical protein
MNDDELKDIINFWMKPYIITSSTIDACSNATIYHVIITRKPIKEWLKTQPTEYWHANLGNYSFEIHEKLFTLLQIKFHD